MTEPKVDRWAHRLRVRAERARKWALKPRWPKPADQERLDRELARYFDKDEEKAK